MKLGSVPAVLGDEAQLRQVFLNLCLNAQDALAQVAGCPCSAASRTGST